MTTAARPTFAPARGGAGRSEGNLSAISKQYSSKDLPAHTKLKYRQVGQNAAEEVDSLNKHDFRRALEERELDNPAKGSDKAGRTPYRSQRNVDPARVAAATATSSNASTTASSTSHRRRNARNSQLNTVKNPDADDPFDSDVEDNLESGKKDGQTSDSDEDEGNSSDGSDDEDDTAELMAELQRIKQERAVEEARRDAERQAKDEHIRNESLLTSNPLLSAARSQVGPTDLRVKRRWDEDVVFKNCAKQFDGDGNKQRRYINDSIRSDFHRRFMEKYIK